MISGSIIRDLRKGKNLRQQDLADRVGVSKTALIDWEHDKYAPGGDNLAKLAKALDVSVSFLLGDPRGGSRTSLRGGSRGSSSSDVKAAFEKNASYLKKLAQFFHAELEKRGIPIPDKLSDAEAVTKFRADLKDKEAMLDSRLSEIYLVIGDDKNFDLDAVLELPFLEVAGLDIPSVRTYARLLRDRRFEDVKAAEEWLKLKGGPKRFFELAELLPRQVWGKFPASEEFFDVLYWIANLPEDRKNNVLELSPEEAKEIYDEY